MQIKSLEKTNADLIKKLGEHTDSESTFDKVVLDKLIDVYEDKNANNKADKNDSTSSYNGVEATKKRKIKLQTELFKSIKDIVEDSDLEELNTEHRSVFYRVADNPNPMVLNATALQKLSCMKLAAKIKHDKIKHDNLKNE